MARRNCRGKGPGPRRGTMCLGNSEDRGFRMKKKTMKAEVREGLRDPVRQGTVGHEGGHEKNT